MHYTSSENKLSLSSGLLRSSNDALNEQITVIAPRGTKREAIWENYFPNSNNLLLSIG